MVSIQPIEQTLNILLVEDNPGDIYIINDLIQSSGIKCNIEQSSSLNDAIQQTALKKFDAVLLDLGLPDSFGIETLEKFISPKIQSPVIVLTGLDDEEVALEALKGGAQDYLVKGKLDSESILRAIRYGIERKKIEDDLKLSENRFRKLNEELELKVIERTEELAKINDLLQDELEERKKIQEILQESEERYRSLVESSPDGVIVLREDFFLYANSVALQMFGSETLQELQLKSVSELIDLKDYALIDAKAMIKQQMKKILLRETVMKSLDGGLTEVEIVGSTIYFEGKPSVQIIIRDITERKKKEKELRKLNYTLKALGESSKAMARAKDEATYLQEVCKIVIEDCGYAMVWIGFAENNEMKSVKPVAHAGFDQGYIDLLNITWADTERGQGPTGRAIRTGKVNICRNMQTDESFKPWREEALKRGYASSIVLPLMSNGKAIGAINIYSREPDAFSEDEENLLLELANDLAYGITTIRLRVVQAKTEEQLRQYTWKLKELNATKDKFFGIIAHDLRNPFSSLLGASEILANNATKFDITKIIQLSTLMYESAKHGYTLLENLLEWAKSQTGTLKFNPQNLSICEVIRDNISAMEVYANSKKISLNSDVATDAKLSADKNMLNTILRNLLNNAIKFTHAGGKITIVTQNVDNQIIFSVKDNGVGIADEDIGKLFRIDKKYVSMGTDREKGTGLGLILCKEFVEKHGGQIWVQSAIGKGSSFSFSIPVQ